MNGFTLKPQNSLFAAQQPSQLPSFGQPQQQQQQQSNGLFGQPSNPLFGATNNATNASQPPQNGANSSVFGLSLSVPSSQQQSGSTNFFGQPANTTSAAPGIFAGGAGIARGHDNEQSPHDTSNTSASAAHQSTGTGSSGLTSASGTGPALAPSGATATPAHTLPGYNGAGIGGGLLLNVGLNEFIHDVGTGTARIEVTAELIERRGRNLVERKRFTASAPVAEQNAAAAVSALSRALTTLLDELVPWVERTAEALPPPEPRPRDTKG